MSSYYTQYESDYAYDRDRVTYAVQRLIVVTTLVFVAQLVLNVPLGWPGSVLGGTPINWLAFNGDGPALALLWQSFTYMFLHGGLSHLFFNMLWLYILGRDVERVLGTRQFFGFYVLCGVLGVLFSLLRGSMVVGASGAVSGVMVAFAMVYPQRELSLFPLAIPINARALVLILIVINIIYGLAGTGSSVETHLGGMAVGFAYMKLVPKVRDWRLERFRRWRKAPRPQGRRSSKNIDAVGRAVDNIFNFEDKKRKRG